MDRAFRSLRHALDTLEIFEQRGIEFRSLTDHIDTTTPMGKCMYQIRNAFAELECGLISERTKAGMAAAKERGVHVGWPRKLSYMQIAYSRNRLREPGVTLAQIAEQFGVSMRTISRVVGRTQQEGARACAG